MIRSHSALLWHCCGANWPAYYQHCPSCGGGVLTVNRVLMRFPIVGGGDLAVVANAEVNAQAWGCLAKMVALTAEVFERHEAKKPAPCNCASIPGALCSQCSPALRPAQQHEVPND